MFRKSVEIFIILILKYTQKNNNRLFNYLAFGVESDENLEAMYRFNPNIKRVFKENTDEK